MTRVSGFTFVHNAIEGGYPIVDAIQAVYPHVDDVLVVDMQSTDGTMDVIAKASDKFGMVHIYKREGEWAPGAAGECLRKAHALHRHCTGDVIVHFEADEVWDDQLIHTAKYHIDRVGHENICVWRLQVEQNFQRIRWYPEPVHRVFPKGIAVKDGHTTQEHHQQDYEEWMTTLEPSYGLLWDVTNCFRDDWVQRWRNQAELWGSDPCYRWVGLHANDGFIKDYECAFSVQKLLVESHWTWATSPLALPDRLKAMVGYPSYSMFLAARGLL